MVLPGLDQVRGRGLRPGQSPVRLLGQDPGQCTLTGAAYLGSGVTDPPRGLDSQTSVSIRTRRPAEDGLTAQGVPFRIPYLLTHHVEDRLLPLKQTGRHPLDPPKSFLMRKARQTELEEWDVQTATRGQPL